MSQESDKATWKLARQMARGLSALLAAWWLFAGIVSGINETGPLTWESWVMAAMITISVVVTVVAWWRAGLGGALMVLFGLAFSTFGYISAGHNEWFAVLISGMPFLVAGVLFLVSWRRHSGSNPRDYYRSRQGRLLEGFDEFAVVLRQVMADHYGQEPADAIVAEARQVFLDFIPRLPYIGGDRNRATNDLVGASYGLALYKVLKARGKGISEIARLTQEVTVRHLRALPWPARLGFRLLRSLIATRPAQVLVKAVLRRRALQSQQRRYPDAPVFIYVEGDGETFDCGIDYVQCPINNFFRAEGAAEFAPYICLYDFEHSRLTGVGLTRTMTLAEGAPRCDFRFKVGGKPVNLQKTQM